MHTVELLEQAVEVAQYVGFEVRQDWLDGEGSGHCMVRGRKLLLLDLAQAPADQLAAVRDALRGERRLAQITMSEQLAECLDVRSAA